MKNIRNKFFQLLRLAIGTSSEIPDVKPEEWAAIYEMVKKQSLLGIAFDGIEKMGNAVRMDSDLLMTWIGRCKQIERRNLQLNEAVVKVSEYFKKNGFEACILKGQGNALMYPKPLHRTPGDIDVWVSGKDSDVIRFVHSVAPDEKASYHHIDFPAYKGIPIEVHYRPCYLQNLVCNRRLQRFFGEWAEEQFSHRVDGEFGSFAVPTGRFNVVYQLGHVFGHLFQEGIGLRQILDYYFVVNDFGKVKERFSKITPSLFTIKEGSTSHPDPLTLRGEGETAPFNSLYDPFGSPCRGQKRRSEPLRSKVGGPSEVSPDFLTQQSCDCLCGVNRLADSSLATDALEALQRDLKGLGLYGFAGAMMYVLHEVLGLDEDKMIVPMDVRRGRMLLEEILASGNFGRYDERYSFGQGAVGHNLQRLFRDLRLVRYYPAEALSEPIFRTWHFLWRLWNKKW